MPPAVGEVPDADFVAFIERFRPALIAGWTTVEARAQVCQQLIGQWRGDAVAEFRVWVTLNEAGPALVEEITGVLAVLGSTGPEVARRLAAQGFGVADPSPVVDPPAECVLAQYVRARVPRRRRRGCCGVAGSGRGCSGSAGPGSGSSSCTTTSGTRCRRARSSLCRPSGRCVRRG